VGKLKESAAEVEESCPNMISEDITVEDCVRLSSKVEDVNMNDDDDDDNDDDWEDADEEEENEYQYENDEENMMSLPSLSVITTDSPSSASNSDSSEDFFELASTPPHDGSLGKGMDEVLTELIDCNFCRRL